MGLIFLQKNPSTWVQFSDWAQIFGLLHGENSENHKICEKLPYFSRKILNSGYPLLPKWRLKMGWGFEARTARPCPNQTWAPPPPRILPSLWDAHTPIYKSVVRSISAQGTHMLRHIGMCRSSGLLSPNILRHGSHFGQKILRKGPHFTKIAKIVKNQPFLRQKSTFRNGSPFAKISEKQSNQPFLREKNP